MVRQVTQVPEKVAWVLVQRGLVLVTRNHGKELFYFPGGHREPGESDIDTLTREISEELTARIDVGSAEHFGTFETRADDCGPIEFRMIC
jgi:8-oxo-dGTP diphosphatase